MDIKPLNLLVNIINNKRPFSVVTFVHRIYGAKKYITAVQPTS